jgi:hypothetical protein
MSTVVEEMARKLGGKPVLGRVVRTQADLALAVRERLPLAALKGLAQAGLTDQEIERFVMATYAPPPGRQEATPDDR